MTAQANEAAQVLPNDAAEATLVGRIWDPEVRSPRVVAVHATEGGAELIDLSDTATTVSDLLERDDAAAVVRAADSARRWNLNSVLAASTDDDEAVHLLAPIDLQVVKACGVTFVDSMLERVIEERVGGDPARAEAVRGQVLDSLGGDLASVKPGSEAAAEVKRVLQEQGLWSQYLEVGIGPDPEVFTKAATLSSVGHGAGIGIPDFSSWNNPEPELVLAVTSRGEIRGVLLGNDVNLRDVEGRSALLLGKAKDNNASSALGPFVRLFDSGYTIDDARGEEISLSVTGDDGFAMSGVNTVSRISRTFEELVAGAWGEHHQYPDGFVLFTGTLFAPTQDRGAAGAGFTHHYGDVVTISSPRLGTLQNTVKRMSELRPWTFGVREFIAAQRRLVG